MHGKGLIAGVFERLDWLAPSAVEEGDGSGHHPALVSEAFHQRIDSIASEASCISGDVLAQRRSSLEVAGLARLPRCARNSH
jgi:hypothetical protein